MNNEDKENYKVTTKIPIPVPPLPGLPPHLLKKRTNRAPLNTLAGPNNENAQNANLAGPSNEQNKFKHRKDSPFKIDTRFVTIKRGCEDSGYFKAYKDDRRTSEPSVICVSSDDESEGNGVETNLCKTDFSQRRASASTPAHHMLQPARIRNIKRSLKRPHSRELLCVSPRPSQDGLDDNRVKRRLNFTPKTAEKIESSGPQDMLTDRLVREYSGDIFSYLIQTEEMQPAPSSVKNETRACVINWLMKINDGNPATIQIAIWYLDKLLSSSIVSLENMQLVAAASFWIATKIEGPAVSASRLVRYSNNAFNTLRLLDAERVILMKLKFPSLKVIPQDFLCYMAWWCNKERPWEVSMAASFLCLCGMMVNKRLSQEYPSVVAAAAIRCALLLLRKKELMPRLQKCSVFVAAENKAESISNTCVILRQAVRTVASQKYPYNYILKLYGSPPAYIAQTIVSAVNELSVVDTRLTAIY